MPIALQRWEYLGGDDDLRAIDGASDRSETFKVVPVHCAPFDRLLVEPIPPSE